MNKKLLWLPIIGLGLAIVPSINLDKNNSDFVEMGADVFSNKEVKLDIKNKVVGEEGEVDVSETFAQYGIDAEGNKYIRFATAVKGDLKSISYNRAALGNNAQAAADIEVTTVYQGLKSGDNVYYYNGSTYSTDETYAGQYYWACYSAKLGSVDYQVYDFNLKITVEAEDGTLTYGEIKTASYGNLINKELDVIKDSNNKYLISDYDENGNVIVKQNFHTGDGTQYGDTYGSSYKHVSVGALLEEASTTYYAEATINKLSSVNDGVWTTNGNTMQGLAHVKSLTMGTPIGNEFITSGLRGYGRTMMMNKWTNMSKKCDSATTWINDYYNWDYKNDTTYKIAVARNGNALYTFFNDQYIGGYIDNEYSNVPTRPGLYVNSYDNSVYTTFSNISALSGNDAINKINILMSGKVGLHSHNSSATNSGNWVINESTEDGVNFDFIKNSSGTMPTHENTALSTHLRYTGDFKVEGDFTFNEIGASGELAINLFTTGPVGNSRATWAQLHTRFTSSGTFEKVYPETNVESGYELDPWHSCLENQGDYFISGSSVHYSITSTLSENSRRIIFTITSNDNPEITYTRDRIVPSTGSSGQTVANWNNEITVSFSARNVTGSWTNVKWTGMPHFEY